MQHAIDHLFGPMSTLWSTSDPASTPNLEKQIADGAPKLAGNRSIKEPDTMLMELPPTRSKGEKAAQARSK